MINLPDDIKQKMKDETYAYLAAHPLTDQELKLLVSMGKDKPYLLLILKEIVDESYPQHVELLHKLMVFL